MKLENQVCSLELAKKLKELGVKQDSIFARTEDTGQVISGSCEEWMPNWVSAFTVAELGEMLPDSIKKDNNPYWYEERKTQISGGEIYYVVYYKFNHQISGDIISFNGNSEADARARMLVYLLENNLTLINNYKV